MTSSASSGTETHKFSRAQGDFDGWQEICELLNRSRARDRRHHGRLCAEPRKRHGGDRGVARRGDLVIVMSNGGFEGIHDKLLAALKASSNKNAKASTIHVYPGMPHAFNADYRPSYRKEAADDGWKRMLAWFKQHGVA